MPIRRSDKVKLSEEYADWVNESSSLLVFDYRGLSVEEFSDLRNKVRDAGGRLRVVRNRMFKRAIESKPFTQMNDLLLGPSAIIFAGESDPVAPAKALVDFAKDHEIIQIKGGSIYDDYLESSQVQLLAKTPTLPELHSKILGSVKAPASAVLGCIKGSSQKLHGLFTAYADKLEQAA
ncbi:MAG: 50S ribosomal protein L10 [Candidatus Hinthialibacter antarcticus]|nr:50S ribosomal protein L10 [Candidatus Hinthialibacter antarcticus]